MTDSRFWRMLAVTMVVGVFYLGHGLHDSASDPLPGLVQEVHAGDMATAVSTQTALVKIITSSQDGQHIYVWTTTTRGDTVHFLGTFDARNPK